MHPLSLPDQSRDENSNREYERVLTYAENQSRTPQQRERDAIVLEKLREEQ